MINWPANHAVLAEASAAKSAEASERLLDFRSALIIDDVATFITSGHLGTDTIVTNLDRSELAMKLGLIVDHLHADLVRFEASFTTRRRGVDTKIIAGERKPEPNPALLRALKNASPGRVAESRYLVQCNCQLGKLLDQLCAAHRSIRNTLPTFAKSDCHRNPAV